MSKISNQSHREKKAAITQLSNQIINSENKIEELKGKLAELGDTSKSSEKYQELTDAIKTHRKRVHVLYAKIEKFHPHMRIDWKNT